MTGHTLTISTRMDAGPDRELYTAARAGRLDAVGELYRRHADEVYALAVRILGSADDAEDVLQDVFVGLPRALRGYREQGRFSAWLKRVTVRVALMRLRASRRKRETSLTALADPAETGTAAAAHPIDRVALERALARLPDKLRLVFVLKEIEGYGHAEIAGTLGISTGASMTRLSRAWDALRKEAAR
jgi:RNA polymerase sigma-70 factor, ECF subfamily